MQCQNLIRVLSHSYSSTSVALSPDVFRVTEWRRKWMGHATSMGNKITEHGFGEETCKQRPLALLKRR